MLIFYHSEEDAESSQSFSLVTEDEIEQLITLFSRLSPINKRKSKVEVNNQ